jgi:hypothetical protein
MANEVIFSMCEKDQDKDSGDAERATTAVSEPRIPTWLILVSSIFLVVLSSLLAFLAVMAFSTVYPIVRPPSPTTTTPLPTSTGAALCAHPAIRQEW